MGGECIVNFFNYIISFFKEKEVHLPVEKLFEEEIDILFGIKK